MDFKKTLLILFLFVGLNTFAQNRLEFNQVITIDTLFEATGSYIYTDTYIVPNNQVAKVVLAKITNNSYGYGNIWINGVQWSASDGNNISIDRPLWLKAGDTIVCGGRKYNSNNITYFVHINIIEFNIVTD